MNLLVLSPHEAALQHVVLTGRRAKHVREVLRVSVGDSVHAAVVGHKAAAAQVTSTTPVTLNIEKVIRQPAIQRTGPHVVLAIPRPKVLTRCLQALATCRVQSVQLTNAWRVEKSYLGSKALAPEQVSAALLLGCEQGGHSQVPDVTVHQLFTQCRDMLKSNGLQERWLLHPYATTPLKTKTTNCWLAVGPEGGFIQREVDTFVELGFAPATLNLPILRVEQAAIAAMAQLAVTS